MAAGALPFAVGVAFDDEWVAGGGEPVDGGLCEQRVVHEAEPFIRGPVRGADGGVAAVPGDGQLVEVAGSGLVQWLECEIVDDQQVHGGQAAVLGFGAVVQPGGFEPFEQVVGAGHVDGEAAADGDVAQRGGQVGLADPDGPQYQSPVGGFGEPQADQLVPQLLVVADGGGGVPGVDAHVGAEPGGAGAAAAKRAGESALAVRTRERYEQVQALKAQGKGIKPIMRETGLAKETVRRFYRAAAVDELPAKVRDGRPSILDEHKPYLHQRWNEGVINVIQLHSELKERGYKGSYGTIRDYLLPFREAGAALPAVPGPPKARDLASHRHCPGLWRGEITVGYTDDGTRTRRKVSPRDVALTPGA